MRRSLGVLEIDISAPFTVPSLPKTMVRPGPVRKRPGVATARASTARPVRKISRAQAPRVAALLKKMVAVKAVITSPVATAQQKATAVITAEKLKEEMTTIMTSAPPPSGGGGGGAYQLPPYHQSTDYRDDPTDESAPASDDAVEPEPETTPAEPEKATTATTTDKKTSESFFVRHKGKIAVGGMVVGGLLLLRVLK